MDLHDFNYIKDSQALINTIELYRSNLKPKGKIYLFLDEIQEIKGWEKVINSLSQQYKVQYEIFLTGSNANVLSSDLATYLSGRYVSFEVFPFGYGEYCGIKKLEKNKITFLDYLKNGGIPEIYSLNNIELQQNYIASLKDSIILRDIIQKNNVRDVVLPGKLVDFSIGRYLENVIYMELKRQQYKVYTGKINGKEIDFIAEANGDKKYIQVTYLLSDETVINREFGNLELIKDNYEKLVISLDDINMGNREGVKHVNAWTFCK